MMRRVLDRIRIAWRIIITEKPLCYISDTVMLKGEKIQRMYREVPIHNADSGWRFAVVEREPSFDVKERSFMLYKLEMVMRGDPSIVPYLNLPVGAVLERVENGRFVLIN